MPQTPADIGAPVTVPRQRRVIESTPVDLIFPWWERPTNQSLDYQTPQIPQVLAAVAGTRLTITSFVVNQAYRWVLRGVNLFVDGPTPLFNVVWEVRFREGLLFDPIRFAGRNLANLEIPYPFAKRGAGPGTLDIVAVNQAATGPWTIAASLSGWVTPDTEAVMTYPAAMPALG